MANDVADLTVLIKSDLARNDVSLSDVILFDIRSAIRDYEAQRFYFNEKAMSVTLSNTNTYVLTLFATAASAADVIEVDDVQLNQGGFRYRMDEIAWDRWVELDMGGITGPPTKYAVFNQSLYVDPMPASGQNYVATMHGHVKYAEVTQGSDSNVWTLDGRELIRNAVLVRMYSRRFKDADLAIAAAQNEQRALAALQRRTDAQSGHIIRGYL